MKIAGIQKLTALDYPEHLACNIFTVGCSFKCPFCHNSGLLASEQDIINTDEILAYLEKRQGILNGVCITGGEPLLQNDLEDFIITVRKLGYDIKLDTNGNHPDKLIPLVEKGLIDYIAMDIKSSIQNYSKLTGTEVDIDKIKRSKDFLMNGVVKYEFRTTVVNELHCEDDFEKIGEFIKGADKYYLQRFVDSGNVLCAGLSSPNEEQMQKYLEIAQKNVPNARIR